MSDFAVELYKLRRLSGADFIAQLKVVTTRAEFHPLVDKPDIFIVGGEGREDYSNLINASLKAVAQGYRVYILPTPKGIRMADFILVRKGVYKRTTTLVNLPKMFKLILKPIGKLAK